MRNWTDIKNASQPLHLAAMGSFHIGGHWQQLANAPARVARFTNGSASEAISVDGTYWVNAMYVQYFWPLHQQGRCPLLLWHGGGLSGVFYETTPDGREGWLHYFLRQGWPVFNCDGVERGRSGWMPYAALQSSEPLLNARHVAFERFRIGAGPGSFSPIPDARQAHADTQFPLHAYDQFVCQQVPRWTDSGESALAAYGQLLQEVSPCVVLAHSQGGQYALEAAMRHPDTIKALVLIEPSGVCHPNPAQLRAMANIPMLVVHGDHIADDPRWVTIREKTQNLFDQLRRMGASIDLLELPHIGHAGNSHLLPIELNNVAIAEQITQWLTKVGLCDPHTAV